MSNPMSGAVNAPDSVYPFLSPNQLVVTDSRKRLRSANGSIPIEPVDSMTIINLYNTYFETTRIRVFKPDLSDYQEITTRQTDNTLSIIPPFDTETQMRVATTGGHSTFIYQNNNPYTRITQNWNNKLLSPEFPTFYCAAINMYGGVVSSGLGRNITLGWSVAAGGNPQETWIFDPVSLRSFGTNSNDIGTTGNRMRNMFSHIFTAGSTGQMLLQSSGIRFISGHSCSIGDTTQKPTAIYGATFIAYGTGSYASINFHHATNTSVPDIAGPAGILLCAAGAASEQFYFNSGGDMQIMSGIAVKASGISWTNPSDAELKMDDYFTPEDCGLTQIKKVKVRNFAYKSAPEKRKIGIIAQEMQEALPSCIRRGEGESGNLLFDANDMIFAAVQSIQELSRQVDELKEQISSLLSSSSSGTE